MERKKEFITIKENLMSGKHYTVMGDKQIVYNNYAPNKNTSDTFELSSDDGDTRIELIRFTPKIENSKKDDLTDLMIEVYPEGGKGWTTITKSGGKRSTRRSKVRRATKKIRHNNRQRK